MSIVAAAMTACKPPAFACDDDDACQNGDAAGVCEPTGFCSFPDKQCDGGRRYGEFAEDGLSRECVPNEIATGTSGVATPESPSSECPPDVNGDVEGIGCLYTDAEAMRLRFFVTC